LLEEALAMKYRSLTGFAGALAGAVLLLAGASPGYAASCGNGPAGFSAWLIDFKREAPRRGVPRQIAESALSGLSYNKQVISLDRSQKHFKKSFEQFAAERITRGRLSTGARMLQRHAGTLSAIERRYGVPGSVIVAIWGLETDYGANTGNMSSLRSLATLAYDCRRADFFRNELVSALGIIARGDLSPNQMRGAWAGELGQTQFLASSYLRFAVDFDGDGRRNLISSVPDALASTANYLRSYGWRRGQGWQPGSANFAVLKQWNKSDVYCRTIALFASRLAGG
jgi:lytic murein transglycosylase